MVSLKMYVFIYVKVCVCTNRPPRPSIFISINELQEERERYKREYFYSIL